MGGKWKIPIIWRLAQKPCLRFGEIKNSLGEITDKMLSKQLKELVSDGFVLRKDYFVIPYKVEYSISPKGLKMMPAIESLRTHGQLLMQIEGIEIH